MNIMADVGALNTNEAAELSGFSARHIQRLIKTGKLSAERVAGGNYTINKAEFYRVFPLTHMADATRQHTPNGDDASRQLRQDLEIQVKHLQEMLSEKKKQNDFLTSQIETAATREANLLDTLASTQRLLEHDSGKQKRRRLFGVF